MLKPCNLKTFLRWLLIVSLIFSCCLGCKANYPPEILMCDNPTKNESCVLCCSSEQTSNVVFFKDTGLATGEGACFIYSSCESKDKRYYVFQNDDETCLRILHLDRIKDAGNWFCEHGADTSGKKELIVHTRISHLTIRPLPVIVSSDFNISAEGYCVYPDRITTRLLPSHGQSNHTPRIKYIKAPKECDDDEYSVLINFNIKPTDFVGTVTFRIEVTGVEGETSFKSHQTSQVYFKDYICPALCAPYVSLMPALTAVILIGITIFLQIRRRGASTNLISIVLNSIGMAAFVCILILASIALTRNCGDKHNDGESNNKCVKVSVALFTLTLVLLLIIIIIDLVQSRRITNEDTVCCKDISKTDDQSSAPSVKTDTLLYIRKNNDTFVKISEHRTDVDAAKTNIHTIENSKTNTTMSKIEGSKTDIAEMTKCFHDPNTNLTDTSNTSIQNVEMKLEAGDTDPLLGKPNRTRSDKYNTLASPVLFPIDTAMANRENDSTHIETNKHLTENLENQPSVVEINRKTPTINIEQSDKSDNLTTKVKFSADVEKTDPSVLRVGSHAETYELIQGTRLMYHMQMGIEHPPQQLSLCVKAE